ncbi:MAG: hypothetical protein HKP27_08145, partial [Myxococcales bacterium]|nr:hypothetical protein [Myxococcales bacterium]
GLLQLDDAHLSISNRLRKVCGVPARVHFTSAPLSGVRVSTLGLELGALRVRAHQTGDGPARAESDWVAFQDLAGIFPALEGRASGGRVRIASALLEGIDRLEGQIEFDDVELAGRRMPLRIERVAGFAAVGSAGFHAEDLRGSVAGIPMKASLEVRVGESDSAGPRVFLDINAPEIDLAKLGIDLPGAPRENSSSEELSAEAIVAAAEGPVALLRQQRARVDDVVVERARVRIGRLRSGGALVRRLDLVLALRSLRLELKRARFNIGKRNYRYAGTIDLNPLVPEVRIAASP